MKRKFTLLIAALALLTMIVQPGRAWGQTKGEITWTASAQGYTNQQEITSVTFDSSVSGSFNKGTNSNPPKYFTSGTAIRCYGGNYFTISSSNTLTAITISFGNSDGSNAITTDVGTYSNGSWTGSANSVTFTIGGSSGNRRIAGFNITYSSGGTPTIATPTITPNGGNFITSQEVSISCTTEDVTIYYTLDGNDPTTTSTQYANPFTITETTTVKAFAVKDGYNDSNIATAEFTKATAMTIAEVRAQQTGDVFTTGIVTSCVGTTGYIQDATAAICVYGASLTVGNEISVSGSLQDYNGLLEITSPQVTVVSSGNVVDPEVMTVAEAVASTNQGWYIRIENATVSAISGSNTTIAQGESTIVVRGISGVTLAVNDIISLNGNIGCYNSNQIANPQNVTVQQPTEPTITLSSYAINVAADGENGSIEVTFENFTNLETEIQFFEADGVTPASYNWMTAALDAENEHVTYQIAANDSDARTAYFKVYEVGEGVYSNLVTVSQAAYVAPTYAALPFEFIGGRADIEDTDGLSQEGLGSDYGSSPKLKFDNTGDWLLLQFSERPGVLTFKVKGNPGGNPSVWAGTFTVQTSTDGETFTDFVSYDDLSSTATTKTIDNLGENVRYIKWTYNKTSGNVALGDINLAKYVAPQASITINPGPYNLNSEGGDAVLPVTYTNMPTDPQAEVIFYESDGETPLTENPTWITATINGNNNVNGNILANTGEARSAYFKVKGIDADNNDVYSDLVTINQAAYVLSIVFETTELDIEIGGEQDRVLSFEYQGFGQNPTFEVRQYDASGETQTTYEWLTTTITQVHKVNITVAANTGAARSGYFKVYGSDGTVNTESNLVTINQAEYVAPTYTVTYDANGGLGTMTDPNSPYVANTEVTLLENTFTAPEGMKWDAWLVQDANQTAIEVNDGKFIMPASNVTVTAQWVDDPYAPTYEWVLTALEDLTSNDVFVIVGTRDNTNYYGMSTDKGTSTQPEAVEVTIANNKLSASPADRIKWNLTGDNSTGYIFYPNGSSTTWLYCNTTAASSSNTNMRVGDGDRKLFIFDDNNYMVTNDDYTDRYVSLNGSTDWRGYVNTNQATTITFYKRQVASTDPQLSANDVNIASDETEGEITYTLENPVSGGILTAEITEGDWLTLGTVGATVPFTCSANTEATARTATVTLTYTYDAKATITATAVVTQAALVIDYATLPFAFDGGRDDIANVNGLTQEGLDSDYGSTPKLKFNSTGDWVILKLNEAPKSLSYDIKGNSFQDGSIFTVQTSADGNEYTDLASYTTLGEVQSITHVDLDADVCYIKWIYTNKKTGNVALGNIHATEHYDTYGDVTLNDLNLTASSESLIVHSGSVVTLTGTVTNDSPDNLVIEDGGQLVFDGTGVKATMKKKTVGESKAEHWYTIASPVNNIDFANITNLTNAATFDLYRYDEATYTWENYKNTAHTDFVTAENGRGYLYYNSDGNELSFAGELNNSASYDLTASGAQMNGLNLIGNPFTQDITLANISLSDDAQISEGFYVLSNNSDWVASVTTVKPCEGFIVKVNKATTATFSKSTGSSKSRANRDYIAFTVANNQYEDVAYAMFSNGLGLDKIDHRNAEIPMVYIPQNGQNYAIATMSDDTEMFNLNFKAMTTGQYTLSVDTKGNYSYLHIYDKMTNEDVDMLLEGEYSFIGSPRDNEARFIVKLSYNANIDEIEANDIFAYQNGSDIIVNGNGELQVFDATGRMVMNTQVNGIQTVNIPATGMYIFRMVGDEVKTQKIVVR